MLPLVKQQQHHWIIITAAQPIGLISHRDVL